MSRRIPLVLFLMIAAAWLAGCSETEGPTTLTTGSDPVVVDELGATLDMSEDLLDFEEELNLDFGPDQGLSKADKSGFDPFHVRMPAFLEALDLTEDQIAAIRIYLAEVRDGLPGTPPATPQERRELCRQLHDDFLVFLESILTEDQLAILDDLRVAQQDRIRDRIRDRLESRAVRVVSRLTEVLDLDETQVDQLATLLADARAAALEIMEARAAGDMTVEDARAAILEIRDALIEDIKAILTPDQLVIFEEILANCQNDGSSAPE